MRIEPNEISRPIRYLPQGISGDSVRWWADLKKYGKLIQKNNEK